MRHIVPVGKWENAGCVCFFNGGGVMKVMALVFFAAMLGSSITGRAIAAWMFCIIANVWLVGGLVRDAIRKDVG